METVVRCGPSGVTHGIYGEKGPFSIAEAFLFCQAPKEAPFSRRFGLQKTGSAGTLGPADMRGAEGILGAGLQRSASSSWLEGTSTQVSGVRGRGPGPNQLRRIPALSIFSQAKEPRLARITPTPSRRVLEPSTL